ncbi:carbohydrate-binding protein SusD [Niabella ginsenosidivorans]|uniref:Carbohydrate-binding protein SusD n=1 Tax=Niabella ginsenosidivorans TaxID=1176587 RepID=A0A1A9I2H1_9BACT|nr:RagB/SusD family nutrient uptake outer membrane protein [Niabella ginsenosidivorans]ANH80774.1 carbohydrate-binding protein SusD [Niabella ginsenosidivorans]
MNRISKLYIVIAVLLFVCACRKNYLEKTDPTKINQDLFYKDQNEVVQAINGCYGLLQSVANNQWLFNEMVTDNTTFDFNPSDRGQADKIESYDTWTYTANNPNINDLYKLDYRIIYNVNNTLFKMQQADLTDSLRKLDEGQLKFIRAYIYFELVQYFGDVILITQPLPTDKPEEAWSYIRKPQDSIYAQIESDLQAAVSDLPNKENIELGRITKGAALTLLGKTYLTRKKYQEAVATLTQILSLGYSLVPDYADNYDPKKKNGPESIFEIQYKSSSDDLGKWSNFIYTFAPRLSGGAVTGFSQSVPSGWNIPTNDLIDDYEANDKRKAASIGLDFVSTVTKKVVPYIKKYQHTHSIYGRTDDNWPVLRYADVLLMLAEAINETEGPTGDAYSYVNEVRQRAGLAPLAGLDKNAFRAKIMHERRIELAFENWRWFDLKRTMTADDLATFLEAYGARERANPTASRQGIPFATNDYQFEPYKALYPIPNDERIINKDLVQNPGY